MLKLFGILDNFIIIVILINWVIVFEINLNVIELGEKLYVVVILIVINVFGINLLLIFWNDCCNLEINILILVWIVIIVVINWNELRINCII